MHLGLIKLEGQRVDEARAGLPFRLIIMQSAYAFILTSCKRVNLRLQYFLELAI